MNVTFTDGATSPVCMWFALCTNDSAGVVEHPLLGYVPTCQRCADAHDLTIMAAEWEVVS